MIRRAIKYNKPVDHAPHIKRTAIRTCFSIPPNNLPEEEQLELYNIFENGGKFCKLDAQIKQFVCEYLIHLNVRKAASNCGWKTSGTGKVNPWAGYKQMSRPHVREAIAHIMKMRAKRLQCSQDNVLREYAKLAFFNPKDLFDEEGHLRHIKDLDPDTAASITEFKVRTKHIKGSAVSTTVAHVKFADKKGALDSVGKHLGMFFEQVKVSGDQDNPINVSHFDSVKDFRDKFPVPANLKLVEGSSKRQLDDSQQDDEAIDVEYTDSQLTDDKQKLRNII
jgi:phage terminase small subunit